MLNVAVIGAGRIGSAIAGMLAPHYRVTVYDSSAPTRQADYVVTDIVDANNVSDLSKKLLNHSAVINAAPHHLNLNIAKAAVAAGIHYLDLTEDVASAQKALEIRTGTGCTFIPQCGLAPGFVSIVAANMAKKFDTVDTVKLRVGALPQFPTNALGYNLTWSTDGLINEYCQPCDSIVDGIRCEVPAMAEVEQFSLDGVRYEAFNTSGGVGTLCDTLYNVRTLNYRTIRYPGHAALMWALLNDLRLRDRREVLADILEHAIPATDQDVVVILVSVSGHKNGRLVQDTYVRKIYSTESMTAIQLTTASSVCAVFDLLATGCLNGHLKNLRQEDIPLDVFLANRFGAVFRAP